MDAFNAGASSLAVHQQRRQQPRMPAERRLRRVLLSLQPLPERGAPHAAAAAAAAAAAGSSSTDREPEMRWGGTKEQMADFFVLHNGEQWCSQQRR